MNFLEFCFFISFVTIALLVIAILLNWLTKGSDITLLPIGLTIILTGVSLFLWAAFGISHNDQQKDKKYCESLEQRGHDTQYFIYNLFNHECYIKVDGQWIEIRDSSIDRHP